MKQIVLDEAEIERLRVRFAGKPGTTEYDGEAGKRFFRNMLFNSVLVFECDFGLIRFTDYTPRERVRIHALFDSKEVFRETEELKALGHYIFDRLSVKWIEALVPSYSRSLRKLLESTGFQFKGTLRKDFYDGKMYTDGALYWLTRRDLL